MKGSRAPVSPVERIEVRERHARAPRVEPVRRGFLRRRRNRRLVVERPPLAVRLKGAARAVGRRLLVLGKVVLLLAVVAGAGWGGALAVRHVINSPRFSLRDIRVGPTSHVRPDELMALTGVRIGDRLLSIDTDAVATRVAAHPWIASARVRRELPSVLAIDIVERHAVAAALLGGLYLVDEAGHPFKHATMEEADGLVVMTGLTREQYAAFRPASEGALREALAILNAYRAEDALAATRQGGAGPSRPSLSEIHIDPRYGFSLFLLDGGGEVRLGRGATEDKLARLDEILEAAGARGLPSLRVVHLDGPSRDRVPVRWAAPPAAAAVVANTPARTAKTAGVGLNGAGGSKKFRSGDKRMED
ncbi:MAG: cell division protein FtsQ [Myxococcales bacterium]|jgi:cell division protein FtsQ|nr:cell division protein FtsQ [Myxococcales bacterium]